MVEAIIKKERPSRGGRELPIEPKDFAAKNALYLPEQARYSYLVNLPDKVNLKTNDGKDILSLGQAVSA
jgi:type I restriction enzyme M protein